MKFVKKLCPTGTLIYLRFDAFIWEMRQEDILLHTWKMTIPRVCITVFATNFTPEDFL